MLSTRPAPQNGEVFVTTPDRPRSGTLWESIRDTLSGEINAGQYRAGEKLPTEAELSRRFGVNRHTVRRALEALQEQGRIHVRRGAGSFVTQGRFDYAIGRKTRLTRNLGELGLTAGRRVLRAETVSADRRQAAMLQIAKGAPVFTTESVGEADGVAIIYARSAFPAERLPGIEAAYRAEDGGITRALARAGVQDYVRRWTRMVAERPGALIARHLGMMEAHPLLLAESLNEDLDGRPVEYGLTWFCSDRVQLVVEGSGHGPGNAQMGDGDDG